MSKTIIKSCIICGKLFEQKVHTHKTCSSECSEILRKQTVAKCCKEYAERHDASNKVAKNYSKQRKKLVKDAREALKQGINYGDYIAKRDGYV